MTTPQANEDPGDGKKLPGRKQAVGPNKTTATKTQPTTLRAVPYERTLLKILETVEDASPCASACLRAAVVFLIGWSVFSMANSSSDSSHIISNTLKVLFIILILGYVALQCISGFNPTFCMSKGPSNLNKEFTRRL